MSVECVADHIHYQGTGRRSDTRTETQSCKRFTNRRENGQTDDRQTKLAKNSSFSLRNSDA